VKRIISTIVALLVAAAPVAGQDLVRTVSGMDRGTVRASYATRPGTCGHEDNVQFGASRTVINGRWNDRRCVEGPAFLQLEIRNGRVDEAEVRVGVESWPRAGAAVTDLGRLAAAATASALLELAEDARDDAGEDLVFAAVIADSAVLVDPLLRLAHMDGVEEDTRKSAVFWLVHATDEDVSGQLQTLAMDEGTPMEVREAAVFGLSQHDGPEANRALKALVTDRDVAGEIRENAIFWLGQSDEDGNVDFLRETYSELEDSDLKEKVIFSMSQVGGDGAVTWLLAVAGDKNEPTEVRKNALFWAGQADGSEERLIAFYEDVTDRDIKQQLIFVYSQGDSDSYLGQLIDIARNETDLDLRENAIFWLGQSDAPEAMVFLEDLIAG